MGFYDSRCMITGLVLDGDTTLVALGARGSTYHPITLGISGTNDRYGTIDGVREDANTRLVLAYFLDRTRDGRFSVDTEVLGIGDEPPSNIEDLLWRFERNNLWLEDPIVPDPVATLDGEPVTFALMAQPVWDTLAMGPTGPDRGNQDASIGAVESWFGQLFTDSPVAQEIYRGRLGELSDQIRQLHAVDEFVAARGLAWTPPAVPSQRYPTEIGAQYNLDEQQDFLDQARRDHSDVPAFRHVFDDYEVAMRERWG